MPSKQRLIISTIFMYIQQLKKSPPFVLRMFSNLAMTFQKFSIVDPCSSSVDIFCLSAAFDVNAYRWISSITHTNEAHSGRFLMFISLQVAIGRLYISISGGVNK